MSWTVSGTSAAFVCALARLRKSNGVQSADGELGCEPPQGAGYTQELGKPDGGRPGRRQSPGRQADRQEAEIHRRVGQNTDRQPGRVQADMRQTLYHTLSPAPPPLALGLRAARNLIVQFKVFTLRFP